MNARSVFISTCVLVGALAGAAGCDQDSNRERAGVVPPIETPDPATPSPTVTAPGSPAPAETGGNTLDRAGETVEAQGEGLTAAIDDAALVARVKAAFVADPALTSSKIDVECKGGVVTLRGDVESAAAVDRAGVVARATEGVTSVNNLLMVATSS